MNPRPQHIPLVQWRFIRHCPLALLAIFLLSSCAGRQVSLPEDYYLRPGDSIALISPSTLPDSAQIRTTVAGLESWGYRVWLGPNAGRTDRTLEQCRQDMLDALANPRLRAIYCIRGGYAATEVMDILPLDSIRRHPKPIIGYSDITVFHSAWSSLGLPSIHASMSAAFTSLPDDCALLQRKMMRGEMPSYTFDAGRFHHDGTAEGILIGGNLSTLAACLHTAYDCTQTDRPFILLLEDVDETYSRTHRYLTILKHMGVLDRMQGLILGDWTDFSVGTCYDGDSRGGQFESAYEMMWREFLGATDVPICSEMPFGHGTVNYPLRLGAPIRLTIRNGKAEIDFK